MTEPRIFFSIDDLVYDSHQDYGRRWFWRANRLEGYAATWDAAVRAAIAAVADAEALLAADSQAQADRRLKESAAVRRLIDPPAVPAVPTSLKQGDRVRWRHDYLDRIGHPKDGARRTMTGHIQYIADERTGRLVVEWGGWPAETAYAHNLELASEKRAGVPAAVSQPLPDALG